MIQDWDEVEALRESLREHMAEIKRLNECLTWEQHRAEHVGTHGPRCAEWGPKHYECLLRAYEALKTQTVLRESLQKRISQESRQVEPVAWLSQGGDVSRSKRYFEEMGFTDLIPLYTAPPKREPLTTEEIQECVAEVDDARLAGPITALIRAIERAHGIGGE